MKKIVVSGLKSVIEETAVPTKAAYLPVVSSKKPMIIKYTTGMVLVTTGTIALTRSNFNR